jgi:Putative adhesin
MSEQQFTTPNPVRLEVKVAAGNIDVGTSEDGPATVALEGPEKLVAATSVELVGDRLLIHQRRKSLIGWFGRPEESLNVRARIPRHSSVEIVTASGEARLDGSFGELEVKSASGDVVVSGELDGDAHVKTVSGGVRLPRLAGDLTVKSVSGDVAADSVGGSVSLKSVSGDLRVGSVREGKVEVQSVSGDVELGVASGTSIAVDASSASGNLSSEVPLSDASGAEGEPSLTIRGNTVSGNLRVFRAAA